MRHYSMSHNDELNGLLSAIEYGLGDNWIEKQVINSRNSLVIISGF
jgi:hypothetical protein